MMYILNSPGAVEENTQLILFELTMSDNIKKTVMTHRAHVPKDK
jgi:hypothetical protein